MQKVTTHIVHLDKCVPYHRIMSNVMLIARLY